MIVKLTANDTLAFAMSKVLELIYLANLKASEILTPFLVPDRILSRQNILNIVGHL